MPSPSGSKKNASPAARPKFRMIVADDVRVEQDGKVTAVGMYTDDIVVAHIPPTVPEPTMEIPHAIPGLTFLVTVIGLEGTYPVSLRLVSPKPNQHAPESKSVEFRPGGSANFILRAQPFLFASFGSKTLIAKVGEFEEAFSFEIRKGVAPAAEVFEPPAKHSGRAAKKRVS